MESEEVRVSEAINSLPFTAVVKFDRNAPVLRGPRAGHYAAVLMDLQMPQMDGIEATRAIRQLPGWQQVPVAALTADVFTETREACLAAGMSEFLGKPVDADKLYPCLLRVLDAE